MRNTIIVTVLLFIVAIAASIFYFSNVNKTQKIDKENLTHIPADAAFLIAFENDSAFYDVFKTYQGFDKILGKSLTRALYTWYNRYLSKGNQALNARQQTFYISFHPEAHNLSLLIHIPLQTATTPEQVQAYLTSSIDSLAIDTGQTQNRSYLILKAPDIGNTLYVHVQPRNLTLSFSEPLLQYALAEGTVMLSDDVVARIHENRDNNALKLFVDHHRLETFFKLLTGSRLSNNMRLFAELPAFSALNFNFKTGTVMFSGRTFPESKDSSYLKLFADQKPIQQSLENKLTNDVAFVNLFGISDYSRFHNGLKRLLDDRNELNQINEQLKLIEREKKKVLDDELLPAIGPEFGKIILKTGEKIGIMSVPDSLNFALATDTISTLESDSSMRRFDHSNLLYYCYGDPFKEFKRPYFVYAQGYVFISNYKSVLMHYMDRLQQDLLLIDDERFIAYDRLQSNRTNVSLFVHMDNGQNLIAQKLAKPYRENFEDQKQFGYGDFYAFSLQLTGNDGEFISNLYGQFTEKTEAEMKSTD